MKLRLLRLFVSISLLMMLSGVSNAAPLPPVEGRGIWIDAGSIPTNDRDMSAFVESLAKANLNVLLPETVRRGYTIYPSKIAEQDPKWNGYDPLAALIREAHARGMEVHPWVWVFRQGYSKDKGPMLTAHPEWTAVNKWGETLSANGGYWLCPSIPAARGYLLSIFNEIAANYDVDGLHLDYIRFENQFPTPYCYNDSCRNQFKTAHGVDPMDIDPFSKMQVTWHLWRENLVNTFIRQVSDEVHKLKPDARISAAVGSYPDVARESLLQNWPHWVDNKWVDFITPMDYTADAGKFRQMVASEKNTVDDRTIIMPGIGLHTHKGPEPAVEQIGIARDAGADGATLFASVYFKDPIRDALLSGPFSNKAEIPFRKPASRVKTLLKAALRSVRTSPADASSYLRDASRLLGYLTYQAKAVGYVEPTPPPLVIPEHVLPTPTVVVKRTATAPVIDGRVDEPIWSEATAISILHTNLGDPAPVQTEVRLAYDDAKLYIAYLAKEPNVASLKETVTKRDGPVFYDDSLELFIDPWARRREYFQLSANLLGAQFDAKVNDSGVNLEWSAAGARNADGWSIEVAIPFASLGVEPPKPGTAWAINFARNRWVKGEPEYLAWSAPYGGFHRPERFGTIIFE